jgi:hypothetical protein
VIYRPRADPAATGTGTGTGRQVCHADPDVGMWPRRRQIEVGSGSGLLSPAFFLDSDPVPLLRQGTVYLWIISRPSDWKPEAGSYEQYLMLQCQLNKSRTIFPLQCHIQCFAVLLPLSFSIRQQRCMVPCRSKGTGSESIFLTTLTCLLALDAHLIWFLSAHLIHCRQRKGASTMPRPANFIPVCIVE